MSHSGRAFVSVSTLIFGACTAVTAIRCSSMAATDAMAMPGGWTMSMTWMLMPGQSWPGALAAFAGMWLVMMVAMMLPSLVPTLWRLRGSIEGTASRVSLLTCLVGAGYFSMWMVPGLLAFPIGIALTTAEMRVPMLARGVPLAVSLVVLAAGALQFTYWKARQLALCRDAASCACRAPVDAGSAFNCGLRLGIHCCYCCAGLTAVLLAVDVMDLRAMIMLTAAITLERISPYGVRLARVVGVGLIAAGLVMFFRAIELPLGA